MTPVFKDEVMLAGWSESHNGGAKVTFWLPDPSALDAFRTMTVAKGKTAGQRLACVLVQIGDDEKPIEPTIKESLTVEKPKGGALARLAGQWCSNPMFWEWLETDPHNCAPSAQGAARCVYDLCEIESRVELDHNPAAQEKFHRLIRGPFQKYMLSRGVTA